MLLGADIVVGAVLIPGAAAPKLVTREMLSGMKPGAVLVDVAIDQGGCFETSRPTTHSDPTFDRRRHHPLLRRQHAGRGAAHLEPCAQQRDAALRPGARRPRPCRARRRPHLRNGLNVHAGRITHKAVAESLDLEFADPDLLMAA
jgi:alanine dehydrogenase